MKILNFLIIAIIMLLLSFCCTTKNEEREEKLSIEEKHLTQRLPHGFVEFIGNINKIDTINSKIYCKVLNVKRYGPQTSPIAENFDLEALIDNTFNQQKEINLQKNKKLFITISQIIGGMGEEDKITWKVIRISKDINED